MTLPSLATVDDLATRLPGGIAAADEDRAQLVLDDVSTLIRAEVETDWVDDAGALSGVPDVVVTVCLAAARRAWTNPNGVLSETIGSYSYRLPDAAVAPGVFLTDEEKRLIRRAAGTVDAGVSSVELNAEAGSDWIYASVEGSDRPLPIVERQ